MCFLSLLKLSSDDESFFDPQEPLRSWERIFQGEQMVAWTEEAVVETERSQRLLQVLVGGREGSKQ